MWRLFYISCFISKKITFVVNHSCFLKVHKNGVENNVLKYRIRVNEHYISLRKYHCMVSNMASVFLNFQ